MKTGRSSGVLTGLLIAGGYLSLAGTLPAEVTRSFTEPYQQTDVAAAEPGVVRRIHVREGQVVEAGALLAELDSEVLEQTLRLAEMRAASHSRVQSAAAVLAIRKKRKETLEPLFESGHANAAEVEKAIMEYEAGQADLELAQEEVALAQIELERTRAALRARQIRSPIDGVITQIHRQLGEYMATTEPYFATIAELDRLRVRFYLADGTTRAMRAGDRIALSVDDSETAAHVEFVSPVVDPDSATARVDVVLENADHRWRSGIPCIWQGPVSVPTTESADRTMSRGKVVDMRNRNRGTP